MLWDVITAAVGIYYWTLRRTYGSLMQGAKLFNDMKEQQRQALRIGDDIIKELFIAQSALAMDDRDSADDALRSTMESAGHIVTELLGEPVNKPNPKALV